MSKQRQVIVFTLLFAPPGSVAPEPIGVLVFDTLKDAMRLRVRQQWDGFPEQELDILQGLADMILSMAKDLGANQLMTVLESTLSNTIQISERQVFWTHDPSELLNHQFRSTVQVLSV